MPNDMLVAYVVDSGQSFEYVQNRHLAKVGITADDLHATAMNNTLVFMGQRTRMQPHGNNFAVFLDGNFEASLLLLDQLWDQALVEYAPNGFAVAVPAGDVLAFADVVSAEGIGELHGVVSPLLPNGDRRCIRVQLAH
jgi:uncharacterized protein YtpQ (UPF0354 family)